MSKSFLGILAALITCVVSVPTHAADVAQGEQVFKSKCERCHTLTVGGAQTDGPNLHGVFGRKAGTAPGWQYSEALKTSGIVWSAETIGPYIAKPRDVVPEGTMNFMGLKKADDRDALIGYLEQATK